MTASIVRAQCCRCRYAAPRAIFLTHHDEATGAFAQCPRCHSLDVDVLSPDFDRTTIARASAPHDGRVPPAFARLRHHPNPPSERAR